MAGVQVLRWARFCGQMFQIASSEELWSVLVRHHLSQKARGIEAIEGTLERSQAMQHGRQQVTILWQERASVAQPDTARSFRATYILRQTDRGERITAFTITETRAPLQTVQPGLFPQFCEHW